MHVRVMDREGLDALLQVLRADGYEVVAPTVRDGGIVNAQIGSADELPIGWGDEQDGGRYRLRRRADGAVFGHALGSDSWKRLLHPPEVRLWSAPRNGGGFRPRSAEPESHRRALLGVRPCELQAIRIQDRVLLGGAYPDPVYLARRQALFIVAVNCTEPGGTCFCASVGSGPRADGGYDLLLTELLEGGHRFVVEHGSAAGEAVLADLPTREAERVDTCEAERLLRAAENRMGRSLETAGLPDLLAATHEHPRWEHVAERCLACGNCTMVCPTCFCTTLRDSTTLTGDHAERTRIWDSCFTQEFSYMHGGSVRSAPASRYRQWLTHKLGSWQTQFGMIGCVGCGRCITWCPVGIDLTEEVAALRAPTSPPAAPTAHRPEEVEA